MGGRGKEKSRVIGGRVGRERREKETAGRKKWGGELKGGRMRKNRRGG